ncbi:MAG: T9SS type A sorting domain-containing protein [Bacteroidales bacterium]|jgi:hypothetical protein|nr:T9SS type A sorting domain-containing protein [Bacteroidales bacterium]
MKKILLGVLFILIGLSQALNAQFMTSGNNIYSTAKAIAPGKDSSTYVMGDFTVYEISNGTNPNFTSYAFKVSDSIAMADSCGYDHFTNKIYVSRIAKSGTVDWLNISSTCDTLSTVQLIDLATDDSDNLIVLGAFNREVELAGSTMSSTAEWDMFIYKISPEGTVLWYKNGFASGNTSAVIPTDIKVISDELYISGSYSGTSLFAGKLFQSKEKQFYLLKTDKDGNDLQVTAGLPIHLGSSSILNNIDFLSTSDIAGAIAFEDSVLIVNKPTSIPEDTLYLGGGFRTDVLYVIDSSDVATVSARVDSFFIADPPNPDHWYFLVTEAALSNPALVLDTIYRSNPDFPELKNYLSIFRGDSIALSFEIPSAPIDFLVDRNDNNNMYGLHNYAGDLQFGQDLLTANTFPSTALVKYKFSGGTQWSLTGSSPTDTAFSTSFCIDPASNIYISGSVGKTSGNHVLTFGTESFPASYDEDCFVMKVNSGNLIWGQIIGDSAMDRMNDIYALDRFTIVGAGEYSKRIIYDRFDIQTSGVRDLFVGSILPYPEFDLSVISMQDESIPLCNGDSVLLVASSTHDCNFQWLKDDISLIEAVNDSLWIYESGEYHVRAISNLIQYDNLEAYTKRSKIFLFEYNTNPNDSISVADTTSFCLGDKALLSIELNSTDSCSWYELSEGFLKDASFFSVTQSGAYFARVESDAGCVSHSDTINITTIAPPNDSITIVEGNNLFCSGESLHIESYDPGINTYVWYKDGDSISTETNSTKVFDSSGAYSVKIINENLCAAFSDTLTLVEIQPPVLESWFAAEASGICQGEQAEIKLSNESQTSYYWFFNNDSIKDYDSPVYFATEAGSYRASVVKEGVCFVESPTFVLEVHPIPKASIIIDSDSVICDNETTRLSVESTDNLEHKWFMNGTEMDGLISSSIDVSKSGVYYSKFTNQFSCTDETRPIQIIVKKSPSLMLNSEGAKTGFCKNDSLLLLVENSNLVSYQWQRNGVNIPVTSNKNYTKLPGEFVVQLKDVVTNCTGLSNALQINEFDLPDNSISFEEKNPLCERDTVFLLASPEASIYEWSLNGSPQILETEQLFKASKNGLYKVRLTNENNCSAISSPISLTFLTSQIPPINQDINYLSTLSYDHIQWYTSNAKISEATEQVYSVAESGFYHVEVTHANGCIAASDEIQICVPFPEISVDHNTLTASEGESYQWFFGRDTIFGATSAIYIAQLSGNYSVDITLSDLCVSRSAEVEVCYPTPVIEIQPNNVLKASLGLSYQWYLNNEAISGADARLYVVTAEGEYKVEVEDLDNCISFSDPVRMEKTLGRNELSMELIEIYPNPFVDKVYLQLPIGFNFSGYFFELQNALGMLIFKQGISANPESIELPSLPSGLYVASIYNNTQRIHIKLIKK